MEPISAWTAIAQTELENGTLLLEKQVKGYPLNIVLAGNSLWLVAEWEQGGRMAFRPVFAANDVLEVRNIDDGEKQIAISLKGITGSYTVTIRFPESETAIFRYTTVFKPAFDMLVPYWPRDIMPLYKQGKVQNTSGTIHAAQVGTRSGLLYLSMKSPKGGSVFYFQNLTALADYCQETETSAGELVGGQWPEIGFKLPEAIEKPLPEGKEFIISDAFVLLDDVVPEDNFQVTQQFMNYLADIYVLLPRPETEYRDWPDILKRGLDDLSNHKGCWKYADGRSYLNAYVSDYQSPPEIMVQLAVLLPLIDHDRWSGEDHHPVIDTLKEGVQNFYYEHLGTILRWLPAWEDRLDYSEEQKRPDVMDSWYLHHPLMNLSRLALDGDKEAGELLMKSIDYVIKVAHHFDYEWPVFYKMTTFEVLKAETGEGQGGEKDVPGAYAHLMIQVWQLTGEKRYLNEAVRAARKLDGLGFDIFYQANNTAFSAGALLRLYKETGDELFLNLSYVCIAAILKNTQIWDCNYGFGENISTFFAIYPLSDAPYTAAYEEQEVFAGIHVYLKEAEGIDILPSVRLLLAELIKYAIHRMVYYYPPMLPKEMLAVIDDIKTGEIDPNLWIALEDLQDGWNKSGQVGQEVYGAGIAFGVVPRQYFKVKEAGFMVFTEYPASKFRVSKNSVTLSIKGDERFPVRIALVPMNGKKLPNATLTVGNGKKAIDVQPEKDKSRKDHVEFRVNGDTHIKIEWK